MENLTARQISDKIKFHENHLTKLRKESDSIQKKMDYRLNEIAKLYTVERHRLLEPLQNQCEIHLNIGRMETTASYEEAYNWIVKTYNRQVHFSGMYTQTKQRGVQFRYIMKEDFTEESKATKIRALNDFLKVQKPIDGIHRFSVLEPTLSEYGSYEIQVDLSGDIAYSLVLWKFHKTYPCAVAKTPEELFDMIPDFFKEDARDE
jgi:regulator of replication initiation timing